MFFQRSALPLALVAAQVCSAIPIAPSQVVLEIQSDSYNLNSLISDVTISNLNNAQLDYANVQDNLDDIGFYLGQLTDSTCISSGPTNSTKPAATSSAAVVAALKDIQTQLSAVSSSVSGSNNASAIAAYTAAQQDLDSTYDFIFGISSTSSSLAPGSPMAPSQPVFTYIQSAQVALENLAANIVDSDYATAKENYQTVSSILSSEIAPVASCSFTGSGSTCTSALTCVQELQLALQVVSEDLLAGLSSTADCSAAGADLSAINSYIS